MGGGETPEDEQSGSPPTSRPWDEIEVPELEEARRRPATPPPAPPRQHRRRSRPAVVAGLLVLAAIGFLVWYFAFRPAGEDAGPGPASTLSPGSLDFGDQEVGRRSPPQHVTLSNASERPLALESLALTGRNRRSFTIARATTCRPEAPVNPGESCAIAIRFRPTGRGERTARLAVSVTGQPSALTVALSGSGVGQPEATLGATAIDVGRAWLGDEPRTGQATLTNGGNVGLRIESIELEGSGAADFEVLDGGRRCSPGRRVRPGRACVLAVRFRPTEVGERRATLVVRHDALSGVSQVELQGTGVGVPRGALSPGRLSFGPVRTNRRSPVRTVTFESTGSAAVRITEISISGDGARHFRLIGGTCEEAARVRPGETCTIDVRFRPRMRGRSGAILVIEANTPAGRHAIELRGRGTPATR